MITKGGARIDIALPYLMPTGGVSMHILIKDIKESGKKKWLLLVPFLLIGCLVWFIGFSQNTTRQLLLQEKYISIQDTINTLAATVDDTTAKGPEEFGLHTIKAAVENYDRLPFVYGALFIVGEDGNFDPVSYRFAEDAHHLRFNAVDYPRFIELANTQDSGRITLRITDSDLGDHDMLVYFRWAPMSFEPQDRYLIVGGVSQYSVITGIPLVLNLGLWVGVFLILVVALLMFYVIIRQGTRVEKIRLAFFEFKNRGEQ